MRKRARHVLGAARRISAVSLSSHQLSAQWPPMLISSPGASVVAYQKVKRDFSPNLEFFSVISNKKKNTSFNRNCLDVQLKFWKSNKSFGSLFSKTRPPVEALMEGHLMRGWTRSAPNGNTQTRTVWQFDTRHANGLITKTAVLLRWLPPKQTPPTLPGSYEAEMLPFG